MAALVTFISSCCRAYRQSRSRPAYWALTVCRYHSLLSDTKSFPYMIAAPETLASQAISEDKLARLGELLVRSGKLAARDLDRAASARAETSGVLGPVLVSLGLVSEVDVAQAEAPLLGLPFVAVDEFPALAPEVDGLQSDFLRTHHLYPLRLDESGLTVAMAAPDDAFILKALELATGLTIHACVCLL